MWSRIINAVFAGVLRGFSPLGGLRVLLGYRDLWRSPFGSRLLCHRAERSREAVRSARQTMDFGAARRLQSASVQSALGRCLVNVSAAGAGSSSAEHFGSPDGRSTAGAGRYESRGKRAVYRTSIGVENSCWRGSKPLYSPYQPRFPFFGKKTP